MFVKIHHKDHFEQLYLRSTASCAAKTKNNESQVKEPPRKENGEKYYPGASKELKKNGAANRKTTAEPLQEQKKNSNMNKIESNEFYKAQRLQSGGDHKMTKDYINDQLKYNMPAVEKDGTTSQKTNSVKKDVNSNRKSSRGGDGPTETDLNNIQTATSHLSLRPKRSRRVPKKVKTLANDPVALHKYYQDQWKKFSGCIPGQNSRLDVRNRVHQKFY